MQASDATPELAARHDALRLHLFPQVYPWPPPYHHPAARDPAPDPRELFLPGMAHAWPPPEQREVGANSGWLDKSGRSGPATFASAAPAPPTHRPPLFASIHTPPAPSSADALLPLRISPHTAPPTLPPRKGKPFEISLTKRCNGPSMLREQYSHVMKEERAEERCMRVR